MLDQGGIGKGQGTAGVLSCATWHWLYLHDGPPKLSRMHSGTVWTRADSYGPMAQVKTLPVSFSTVHWDSRKGLLSEKGESL